MMINVDDDELKKREDFSEAVIRERRMGKGATLLQRNPSNHSVPSPPCTVVHENVSPDCERCPP